MYRACFETEGSFAGRRLLSILIIQHTSVRNAMLIAIHVKLKKVKSSRYRPGVAQRVGRGIALLFHDRGTRRG